MPPLTAWLLLLLAGALEVVWLIAMKWSDGFTRLIPSVVTGLSMLVSVYCAALAVRAIPAGTAYAVWTGTGAAGAAVAGIVLFGESRSWLRLLSIGLILAGIIGLKLTSERS